MTMRAAPSAVTYQAAVLSFSTLSIDAADVLEAHRRAVAVGHDRAGGTPRRAVSWPSASTVKAWCRP